MTATLTYAIKFVGNMEEAVRFHTEHMGLKLRFKSPEWSEFDTGKPRLPFTSHPMSIRRELAN